MTAVDEIKSRLDIVDIVSETVNLRHSGKNYTGFCPFHTNTKTPAFVVFPDTQTWRCFGQCNDGGDIFSYVMRREGWDFPEALRHLADRAGVTLHEFTPEEKEKVEENEHLREVLSMAVTFFQHQLRHSPAGAIALDYLHARALTDDTIEAFALGYAPNAWDALTGYMTSRNISEQDLIDAGLVSERESGGVYDRFRHRLMIPIRDHRGRMVGFGGRVLDPDAVPKYLNSPKTAIFDKGRLLYGLDMARREIRTRDQVVIVEGYLDVIGPYQAGYKNCVSPMGTALTEDQFRLIKRYSRRIVLALDPDAAGEKATLRGLETARQTLDREGDVVFDARGLLRVEGRLKADIRVVTLPDGLDPDEIALEDADHWGELVDGAKPVVIHVMETLASHQDIDDPKVKEAIANQVLPLIEDVKGSVEREAYRQRLARLLKVDERALIRRTSRSSVGVRRRVLRSKVGHLPASQSLTVEGANRALPQACIHALLSDPTLLHFINKIFRRFELACVGKMDFNHADHQVLFDLIEASLEQDNEEPESFVRKRISQALLDSGLLDLDPVDYPDWRLQPNAPELEMLVQAFIRLRRQRIDEGLDQLVYLQSQEASEPKESGQALQDLALSYATVRANLDRALQQSFKIDDP